MTSENGKNVLLIFLVMLSLALSWSIWTYQGEYISTTDAGNSKTADVAIEGGSSHKLSDIIQPYQVVYETDGQLFGLQKSLIGRFYSTFLNCEFKNILPGAKPRVKESGPVYTMVFPGDLTMGIVQRLFNINKDALESLRQDERVDRIEVFQKDKKAYAIFKYKNKVRFSASLINFNGDFIDDLTMNKKNRIAYFQAGEDDRPIYLTDETVTIPKLFNSGFEPINWKAFKNVFFSQTDVTYNKKDLISSGPKYLSHNQYTLKYYNSSVPSSSPSNIHDPIYSAFNFINGHKGWTDKFIYTDVTINHTNDNESTASVEFRMKAGDYPYPVFPASPEKNDYQALIEMTFKNGSDIPAIVNRTLVDVGSIYEDHPVTLLSGRDALEAIKAVQMQSQEGTSNKKVPDIQAMRLGYLMNINSQVNTISMHPKWFYKTNGQWHVLDSSEAESQGGTAG